MLGPQVPRGGFFMGPKTGQDSDNGLSAEPKICKAFKGDAASTQD